MPVCVLLCASFTGEFFITAEGMYTYRLCIAKINVRTGCDAVPIAALILGTCFPIEIVQ